MLRQRQISCPRSEPWSMLFHCALKIRCIFLIPLGSGKQSFEERELGGLGFGWFLFLRHFCYLFYLESSE